MQLEELRHLAAIQPWLARIQELGLDPTLGCVGPLPALVLWHLGQPGAIKTRLASIPV
jgi:hypothetical protein